MFRFLILIALFTTPGLSWADVVVVPHQTQGFESYVESSSGIQFSCKKQCFIVLGGRGQNEYIKFIGDISGNGTIGYGYLNGQQIIPGEFISVSGLKNLAETLVFTKNPYYSQIPKELPIIIIMEGDLTSSDFSQETGMFSFEESISRGWNEALEYKPFSPRTINFLEGPLWNGKYINEVFFWWIVFFLVIAFSWYFFEKTFHSKTQNGLYFGAGVLVFFWVFFDFLSTSNEIRMYKEFTDSKNIMDNGRLGKNSDFYAFLDFIKQNTEKEAKGIFASPYPYDSEGKYHIYPDIKFDNPDKVQYIFTYNPYGNSAPFGFKDPVFDKQKMELIWQRSEKVIFTWSIQREASFGSLGKIYYIKR